MAQQQNVKSIRTENWHILPLMLPLSPGSWFCWHRHYPHIIEGEFCPAHRATQALVLMLKDAMVPVNKGVVSYNQTFMFAQAFHKGFPLWSFPLYPRPTRMQTPSYGKDSQKGWEENIASPFFFFCGKAELRKLWLSLCSVESTTADRTNGLKTACFLVS